jgi:phosphatidylglycerol:prolipoprotein diacylglycerol transferase
MMSFLTITIGWDPNITTIGGLQLTWHGLFTALGILAGVQLALRLARAVDYDEDDAYTLALVGIPSGIVGSRLLFVAEHWETFENDLGGILRITEGGISVWGAIIGGVAGSLTFAIIRGYDVRRGLDLGGAGLILGQAVGRLGDLVNGEHIADASDLPWAVVYTHPDSPAFNHSLAVGAHHPATTYEMLGDLAILGVLLYLYFGPFRWRPGLTFIVYIVGYATMRFFLTYLRQDGIEEVLGTPFRVPQLVSLSVIAAAIPLAVYFIRQPREDPPASSSSAPPASAGSP